MFAPGAMLVNCFAQSWRIFTGVVCCKSALLRPPGNSVFYARIPALGVEISTPVERRFPFARLSVQERKAVQCSN